MNKPITVKAHLSIEAIETRYRQAKDPVERSLCWLHEISAEEIESFPLHLSGVLTTEMNME
jgi:hypothetical protein